MMDDGPATRTDDVADVKPVKPLPYVRLATRFDLPGLEGIMRDVYGTAHSSLPPYDPDHFWMHTLDLIRRAQVAVAAEIDGVPIGMFALVIEASHLNPRAKFCTNAHFYVHSRYRRHGAADRLLAWAKNFAAERGMGLQIRSTFGTEPEVLGRWFRIEGFAQMGGIFWWDGK